jgi:hypothetical protein
MFVIFKDRNDICNEELYEMNPLYRIPNSINIITVNTETTKYQIYEHSAQ